MLLSRCHKTRHHPITRPLLVLFFFFFRTQDLPKDEFCSVANNAIEMSQDINFDLQCFCSIVF